MSSAAHPSKGRPARAGLPRAKRRPRVPPLVYVLFGLQLVLPASYYCRDDSRDERFAWRMFSPVRNQRCAVHFFAGQSQEPIDVNHEFHTAWIGLAERGRQQIIEAMAQKLCEQHDEGVRVRVACERRAGGEHRKELADRTRTESDENVELVAEGTFNYCEVGSL